ncbi:hypothetical protein [Exiguobacterium acetylicum]|uniref:hypothetical protein n=1 Tax=Exiguobacterium acetylicum TaxID=41170 RepID=UPI001EE17E6C|nr:hypothetical protein [Exiguobacterium acetylicum]UKS57381.1 hypothetical protein K6T22_07155 [Exiguobacterium acetylicum]
MHVQWNDKSILELILIVWAIGAIIIIVSQARSKKSLKSSLISGTIVNLLYTIGISLLWFYTIAVDGISQVLVVYFFAGIFTILEILFVIVLLIVKRKKSTIS